MSTMSNDTVFCYRPLLATEQGIYDAFTFPSLRSLLQHANNTSVFTVCATDADGSPVGLALGRCNPDPNSAESVQLASLFVRSESRGAGVGAGLLAAFSELCKRREKTEICATYMTGQRFTGALERLLARSGWSAPETRMLAIRATLKSIQPAPWMKTFLLPERMEIVRWLDLSQEDRTRIAESQQEQAWIPADLYPFDHEINCDPVTSLALKLEGRVVGWVINHQVENVLRFTCSFMHQRQQRMGRIFLLYNEAVARMPEAGMDTGMWTVPVWHPAMAAFARRWMAPYATRFDETRGTWLKLAPPFDKQDKKV